MIDGIVITPLTQVVDDRGKVMHMLRKDAPHFSMFGEIYFSCIHSKAIKAWKRHKQMTLNCAVIYGEVKFVVFDDREHSVTKGMTEEYSLSPDNYCLITVPPNLWTGFQGLGDCTSILANCATLPHDPSEAERKDIFDQSIPYGWDVAHS